MSILLETAINLGIRKEEKCDGLYFRGRVGTYGAFPGKRYIAQTAKLIVLKKKSCPGCGQCDAFWEWFTESEGKEVDFSEIEDGKIYVPIFIVDGTDIEGGYVDDWHYEFKEVKDGDA